MESTRQFAEEFVIEIRKYVEFVDTPSPVTENDLKSFSQILTRLLQFGEACPDVKSDCEIDAPSHKFPDLYKRLGKRFPEFGYYNSVSPSEENLGAEVAVVGDALDDVCDIYIDLSEALFYFDQNEPMECLFSAKTVFFHWGRHIIDLKSYIHKLVHELI